MSYIEVGLEVYLRDGSKAEYLGKVPGAHVVSPIFGYHGWDGEYDEGRGGALVVQEVFEKPPVAIYDADIAERRKELAEMEDKAQGLRDDIQVATSERVALIAKLRQVPALKRIEDFIEGRMTHFITVGYGDYEIKPISAINEDGRSRDLKLITLFGGTKGDLMWRLNSYSDGSGSNTDIIPCMSEEEGVQLRAARIRDDLEAGMLDVADGRAYVIVRAVERADKWGIEVNEEQRAAYRIHQRAYLEKERVEKERQANTYGLQVAEIDAKLAAL